MADECVNCIANVLALTEEQARHESLTRQNQRLLRLVRQYRKQLRAAEELLQTQDVLITMLANTPD